MRMTECTECHGRFAHHTTTRAGVTRYLCCRCHVAEGGSPADWHGECMAAYAEKKRAANPVASAVDSIAATWLAERHTVVRDMVEFLRRIPPAIERVRETGAIQQAAVAEEKALAWPLIPTGDSDAELPWAECCIRVSKANDAYIKAVFALAKLLETP